MLYGKYTINSNDRNRTKIDILPRPIVYKRVSTRKIMANLQDRSEVVVMIMDEAEKLPEEFNEKEMIHLFKGSNV